MTLRRPYRGSAAVTSLRCDDRAACGLVVRGRRSLRRPVSLLG